MLITSSTGPTAARQRSRTWCCCGGGTTGRSTKAASGCTWTPTARRRFCGPAGGRCRKRRRPPPGTGRRWRRLTCDWRRRGIGIDADTAPRWQGERLDLGWPSACCGARDRRRPRAGRSRGNVRTVTAGGRSRQRLSSVLGAGAVPRSAPRPSRDPASLSRRHSPRVPAEACHLPSRRWPPTVEPAVGRGGLSYIAVGGDP